MYIRAFKLQYLLFKIAQLVQLSDNNASLASIFASEFNDLNIFVSVITSLSAQKIGRGRARPFSLLSPSRSHRPTPVYDLQTTAIIPLNACWQHITFIAVRCNFIKAETCMPARIPRRRGAKIADLSPIIMHYPPPPPPRWRGGGRKSIKHIKHIVAVATYTCFVLALYLALSWTTGREQDGGEEAQM